MKYSMLSHLPYVLRYQCCLCRYLYSVEHNIVDICIHSLLMYNVYVCEIFSVLACMRAYSMYSYLPLLPTYVRMCGKVCILALIQRTYSHFVIDSISVMQKITAHRLALLQKYFILILNALTLLHTVRIFLYTDQVEWLSCCL